MNDTAFTLMFVYQAIVRKLVEGLPNRGAGALVQAAQFILRGKNVSFLIYPFQNVLSQQFVDLAVLGNPGY